MGYICGKSNNKIVHNDACRYVKMIPKDNRKYFDAIEDAMEEGYKHCRYCSRMNKYMHQEKNLKIYCKSNGLFYRFNVRDGAIDVVSRSGRWKIITTGGKHHYIHLYHRNYTNCKGSKEKISGYHKQRVMSENLQGYMEYIVDHDRFRMNNPLFEEQLKKFPSNVKKGTKMWKWKRYCEEKRRLVMNDNYAEGIAEIMAEQR